MKVGDLVKLNQQQQSTLGSWQLRETYLQLVGLIVGIPEYDRIVEVMWSDGKRGHINKECLEVINEDRE